MFKKNLKIHEILSKTRKKPLNKFVLNDSKFSFWSCFFACKSSDFTAPPYTLFLKASLTSSLQILDLARKASEYRQHPEDKGLRNWPTKEGKKNHEHIDLPL